MRNRRFKNLLKYTVTIGIASSMLIPSAVMADSVMTDSCIILGEDLTDTELATVLDIWGITEEDLEDYTVVYITNEQEHEYLDSYLDDSVIGTRALSCAMITDLDGDDTDIEVETQNISYCTTGMYENALTTAGVTGVECSVAGPYNISGTAALIGIAVAYEEITGEEVDEDALDAAINEAVVTGELKEEAETEEEAETMEGVIAYAKEAYANGELKTEEDIDETLDEAEEAFNVSLSDEDRELIKSLIDRLDSLDLDEDAIANTAQSIYEKLSDAGYDIDMDSLSDMLSDSSGFFAKLKEAFSSFFSKLFGN